MVQLSHVKYQTGQNLKDILLLIIGTKDNKLCGFNSKKLSNDDVAIIKDNLQQLDNMNQFERYHFIKSICSEATSAYCELVLDRATIVDTYKI